MSGPVTFAAVKEAVDLLAAVVNDWETSPETAIVSWRGTDRRAVTAEVEQAAVELFELVGDSNVEESAKAIVLAVDDFDDAFFAWADKCRMQPDRTDPGGGPEVWDPYNRMLAARIQKSYPRPEPIQALVSQKVSHQQIAKIYGWRDPSGAGDLQKVQEEITSPGMHFNPQKWIHPAQLRAVAEIQRRWSERQVKHQRYSGITSPAEPKVRREAPESLDELIYAGVNVLQIVKMKRLTPDDVRERAALLGVPLDGSVLATAAAMNRRPSPTEDEEEISRRAEDLRILGAKDYGELGTDQKARIIAISEDGRPPRDIVKILTPAFPGLTYQKVTRIIEEAKLATAK